MSNSAHHDRSVAPAPACQGPDKAKIHLCSAAASRIVDLCLRDDRAAANAYADFIAAMEETGIGLGYSKEKAMQLSIEYGSEVNRQMGQIIEQIQDRKPLQ
jgi:hypothetical protein